MSDNTAAQNGGRVKMVLAKQYVIREQHIEYRNKITVETLKFTGSKSSVEWFKNLTNVEHEKFIVVYLDAQNQAICFYQTDGTFDANAAYPNIILRNALLNNAVSIILIHNHPTGNPAPSDNDCQMTRKMIEGAYILNIRIIDHIIIGDNGNYYSFHDNRRVLDQRYNCKIQSGNKKLN
jgi:DNA repair protein RadC